MYILPPAKWAAEGTGETTGHVATSMYVSVSRKLHAGYMQKMQNTVPSDG